MSHACGESASDTVYMLLYVLLDTQSILLGSLIKRPFIFKSIQKQCLRNRQFIMFVSNL